MAGVRPLSIGLTMVASFCLSFGVMWWRTHAHSTTVQTSGAGQAGVNIRERLGAAIPAPAETADRAPAEASQRPSPGAAPRVVVAEPEAIVTPPSNYDGPELPVMFNLVMNSIHKQSFDASGDVRYDVVDAYEGIIYNTSGRDLSVTATEVNIATQETWQTEFTLPKGTQKHFSVNDGLKMASGDQLTLRSPAFRDSVRQIP